MYYIKNHKEYKEFLVQDASASKVEGVSRWNLSYKDSRKFVRSLRKAEYFHSRKSLSRLVTFYRFQKSCIKHCCSIPLCKIGPGLSMPHPYGIIIGCEQIGPNASILQNVTIGGHAKHPGLPIIGSNVYIGAGAVILGGIRIADGVAIGANAVVLDDILEPNTSWAGVPATKISNKGTRRF
jgi:serine O-acetyltransferase